jgi:hypothetical protein
MYGGMVVGVDMDVGEKEEAGVSMITNDITPHHTTPDV